MAERRMFAKTIIDSDAFLELPATAQLLYFHLSMRADDDGFINKPKSIMRLIGSKDDDMNILIMRKFVISFESGVVVIKHWRIHNYIRKDTYNETTYKLEKSSLELDENKAYKTVQLASHQRSVNEPSTTRQRSVDDPSTQVRLGKVRLGNNIKENKKEKLPKHKHGSYEHVLLTEEEYQKLLKDYANAEECITYLDEYIEMKGYKANSHYLAIKKWVVNAVKEHKQRNDGYGNYRRQRVIPVANFMKKGYSEEVQEDSKDSKALDNEIKRMLANGEY